MEHLRLYEERKADEGNSDRKKVWTEIFWKKNWSEEMWYVRRIGKSESTAGAIRVRESSVVGAIPSSWEERSVSAGHRIMRLRI
jgi:hypothetical protein